MNPGDAREAARADAPGAAAARGPPPGAGPSDPQDLGPGAAAGGAHGAARETETMTMAMKPRDRLRKAFEALREAAPGDEERVKSAAREVLAALQNVRGGEAGSKPKATKKACANQWKSRKEALLSGLKPLVLGDDAGNECFKTVVLFEEIAASEDFQELLFVCLDAMSRALQLATSKRSSNLDVATSQRALELCSGALEARREAYATDDRQQIKSLLSAVSVLRIMQVYRVRVSHVAGAEMAKVAVERFYSLLDRRSHMKRNAWEREVSFSVKELTELIVEFRLVQDSSWNVDLEVLVQRCVELHWFQLMSKLVAADASKELARVYIRTALSMEPPNMWKAHSCMKDYRLEGEFPQLVQAFRRGALESCAEKGKHSELLFRLERYRDPKLTAFVTGLLVDDGRHWLAQYLADRLGLARDTSAYKRIDRHEVERTEQQRRQEYLSLPAEIMASVVFVNSDAAAAEATAWLRELSASDIVGMDGEWKASLDSRHNLASVLQLSSRSRVFLLDLLWLMASRSQHAALPAPRQALCDALEHMFVREDVVKIAYGFSSDVDVLTRSYPGHSCWRAIHSLLDLAHVSLRPESAVGDEESAGAKASANANAGASESVRWTASRARKVTRGLKDVVLQVLGKKLAKLEQLSNWEARPLRPGQTHYAALDAFVLTQIADAVFPPPAKIPRDLLAKIDRRVADKQAGKALTQGAQQHEDGEDLLRGAKEELARRCAALGIRLAKEEAAPASGTPSPAEANDSASADGAADGEGAVVDTIKLTSPMVSVKQVAKDLGVAEEQVLKSMAYMVHRNAQSWNPVLVLVRGDSNVKETQLAAWAQSLVRRATADECLSHFGLPGGGLGPVSAISPGFAVLCDSAVREVQGAVHVGLGSRESVARFDSVETLLRVCGEATQVAGVSNKALTRRPSLRPSSALESKFLVDNMLGRLGKVMRMVGMDCAKVQDVPGVEELLAASVADSQLPSPPVEERAVRKRLQTTLRSKELKLGLAAARAEKRIFVTTDRKVVERYRDDDVVLLDNFSDRYKQFDELCRRFAIKLDASSFLSRCMACNGDGFDRIDRAEVARLKREGNISVDRVSDGILDTVGDFYRCKQPACHRVFWEGPKFDHCWELYETLKNLEQGKLEQGSDDLDA